MSRSRNLKPGFFKNDRLAECDPLARILFQGLWCEADREGRLEDRPKKIKAECLPYDDCDIEALLAQLVGHGFIVRYVVDGARYIAIPQFAKHQNPHVKESPSVIPAPDKSDASPVLAPEIPERAGLIPDSLLLIPDSLQRPPGGKPPSASFAEFWSAYPNKKGRQDAEKIWKRRSLAELLPTLLADVAARKRSDPDWLRGAIPHGKTYLNQSRWLDAVVPDATPTAASGPATNPGGISPRLDPAESKRQEADALAAMKRWQESLK